MWRHQPSSQGFSDALNRYASRTDPLPNSTRIAGSCASANMSSRRKCRYNTTCPGRIAAFSAAPSEQPRVARMDDAHAETRYSAQSCRIGSIAAP